jgi:chaperonin GroES
MLKPLYDKVVLKPDPKPERIGSIYLPETNDETSNLAEVVAVGPGKKDQPMTVKVGDRVAFNIHCVQVMECDGMDYYVIEEDNIFGIL